MSAKSRGNYPIGMYVTEEHWNNIFKEKPDELEERSEFTNRESDRIVQKEISKL
jgi:tetrahydromethanopterin S-methyltransferase subunit G